MQVAMGWMATLHCTSCGAQLLTTYDPGNEPPMHVNGSAWAPAPIRGWCMRCAIRNGWLTEQAA